MILTLSKLLKDGYFPRELPPPFRSGSFARFSSATPNPFPHEPKRTSRPEIFNLARTGTPPAIDGIAHGTAVAGALLYGPLNDYDTSKPLPTPSVSVVSIRALPTSNPTDMDLYESIDVIEAAVPSRKDIKVFNISFGPRGPILDDTISRFTFALDLLAVTHKSAFIVAVGNDGAAGPGMNRIQAPADLVNGLGVGAFTERKNGKVHAPYSCQGPGRECGKLKPDVVALVDVIKSRFTWWADRPSEYQALRRLVII